jgi:hypothetical protein
MSAVPPARVVEEFLSKLTNDTTHERLADIDSRINDALADVTAAHGMVVLCLHLHVFLNEHEGLHRDLLQAAMFRLICATDQDEA